MLDQGCKQLSELRKPTFNVVFIVAIALHLGTGSLHGHGFAFPNQHQKTSEA